MTDVWTGGGNGFPPAHVGGGSRSVVAADIDVTVGNWFASARAKTPRDGTWAATLTDWSGWLGGTAIEIDSSTSPTGDGVVSGPVRLGARTVTLTGMVLADSRTRGSAAMERAGDEIASVLTGGVRLGEMTVRQGALGLTRATDVRLAQSTDFEILTPWVARWGLYLTAADPLRYGVEETTIRPGQTVRVPNAGTIISRPVVQFVGPLTAPTITANGGTFTLGADVPAGSTLTADMRQRIVWLNGSRTFTPARGFWQNVPTGGTDFTLGGSGSGYARVRRSSAWT